MLDELAGERGQRFPAEVFPADPYGAVLDRVRPAQVVVMETELWPNLFRACGRRRLNLTIANARLSPRSFRGYGRVRGFAAGTLSDVTVIAAQSKEIGQMQEWREQWFPPLG